MFNTIDVAFKNQLYPRALNWTVLEYYVYFLFGKNSSALRLKLIFHLTNFIRLPLKSGRNIT